MKYSKIAFAIAILFVALSCTKKSDPELSNTDKLCGKAWKIVTATITPALNGTTDYLAGFDACQKDNLITYNTNNTWVSEEGATKCDPSDPQQVVKGTWSWNSNETAIISKDDGASSTDIDTLTILQNDGNTLKNSQVVNIGGKNYTIVGTFTR